MGEIITFYSYKGGTGRSMALANIAALLAKQNKRVLMIDWDLEAPGLDVYFSRYNLNMSEEKGLLEYFRSLRLGKIEYGSEDNEENRAKLANAFRKINDYALPIQEPTCSDNLFLLKAGKQDADYQTRLQKFNWEAFFKKVPTFFTSLANYLAQQFDYVLIDSRTGHTDISSICTALLPEKLVLVFTPNEQSLNGVLTVAQNVTDYRIKSNDMRPLMIYPLPSRVDLGEDALKREWEGQYKKRFEDIFISIYGLPRNSGLESYFGEVQIPYLPRFSYGESISVLEPNSPNSITNNYERFIYQLTKDSPIWSTQPFRGIPFELSIIYDDSNETEKNILLRQLTIFQRQNILRWDNENMPTIDNWDDNFVRKLTTKNDKHFIVLLINENLQEKIANEPQKNYVQRMLSLVNNSANTSLILFPIWASGTLHTNIRELFLNKAIYPSRRKPLNVFEDIDETWNKIVSFIRTQLLNNL